MNIADFVATRQELTVSEFREKFPDVLDCTGRHGISKFLLYEDWYWIAQYENSVYYLLIENNGYIDFSLKAIEAILFAWAHK